MLFLNKFFSEFDRCQFIILIYCEKELFRVLLEMINEIIEEEIG